MKQTATVTQATWVKERGDLGQAGRAREAPAFPWLAAFNLLSTAGPANGTKELCTSWRRHFHGEHVLSVTVELFICIMTD